MEKSYLESEKIKIIEEKLINIENKIDTLLTNNAPMLSLLEDIIRANLSKTSTNQDDNQKIEKELAFKIKDNFIYVYGKKTFDSKEILKANFSCEWVKNLNSWKIPILNEACEKRLITLFPSIEKED